MSLYQNENRHVLSLGKESGIILNSAKNFLLAKVIFQGPLHYIIG